MIKVLHFVSTPAIWSGVMSVIMNYYRYIDRSKIQFDFLCFMPCQKTESYEKEIQSLGGQVYFIKKPGSSIDSMKMLVSFFREHTAEYSWLHNHEVYLSFILEPLAKQYGVKNFIVHCHATKYSDRSAAAFRNRILCFPIRFMKCRRFACSEVAGAFLYGKKALKEKKVYLLHNAIDIRKYAFHSETRQQIRNDLNLKDSFVIGHIGRFVPQKNHKFLIRIFSELLKENASVKLVLVGDGPLRQEIKQLCEHEKIDNNILFLGQQKEIGKLLSAMDILVLPSIFEGLGIVLLEALANGLPAFASEYVPSEVNISSTIQFLPLNESQWISSLNSFMMQSSGWERQQIFQGDRLIQLFQEHHYEIRNEAWRLEAYYENPDTHVNV